MSEDLPRRLYGTTGQQVSVIGLGGAGLDKYSLNAGVATVRRALELGVTYFDTSPSYGDGASQVILGNALEGRSEPHTLATKLGHLATPAAFRSVDALRAQLWENLRALRRKRVDTLQVHMAEFAAWWKDGVSTETQLVSPDEDYDFANAPVMQVLLKARASGLCRYIGITSDDAERLAFILGQLDVDVCLVAYGYNLIYRNARRSALPISEQKGVAYIAAGIVKLHPAYIQVHPAWLAAAPSWVTPELRSCLGRLCEIQTASGLSPATLAVRYLLADSNISTILVGAGSVAEIEESVAAAQQGPLPAELHQEVEQSGLST